MNREEFLLLKLAEECQEVAKRAIKQIQFGAEQVWKAGEVAGGVGPRHNEGINNAQRLTDEVIDLSILCDLLQDAKEINETPSVVEYDRLKTEKIAKLNKYIAFSRTQGKLPGDWTI